MLYVFSHVWKLRMKETGHSSQRVYPLLLCCCYNNLIKSNSRKKGFILLFRLSYLRYEASRQERCGTQSTKGDSHMVSPVSKQRWVNAPTRQIPPIPPFIATHTQGGSSLWNIIEKKNVSPRWFQSQSSWQWRLRMSKKLFSLSLPSVTTTLSCAEHLVNLLHFS